MCKHTNIQPKDEGFVCGDCGLPLSRHWMETVTASLRLQMEEIPAHWVYEVDWKQVEERHMVVVTGRNPSERAADMLVQLLRLDNESHCGTIIPEHLISIKELSVNELARTEFGSTPEIIGYFSLPHRNAKGEALGRKEGFPFTGVHVHIYWDGTAVAIDRCWKYQNGLKETSVSGVIHRAGMKMDDDGVMRYRQNDMMIRFYLLGCNHEYEEVSGESVGHRLFRMEHAHKCKKCGHVFVVDTSD